MNFSVRLQQLMDERSMSIYTLAKRSGVSWNTIKNFFVRSSANPTLQTLELLCKGLGISLAQFFDVDGETVVLTAEQQRFLDRWNTISDEEKQIISNMLDVMLSKK